jgi:GNAT superfamily N-acetyltransferase
MIRLIDESDIEQIVSLVYEIKKYALYGSDLPLDEKVIGQWIVRTIKYPDVCPCFVDPQEGELAGLMIGIVDVSFFANHKHFDERAFYIREPYRSYARAKAFIDFAEKWCRQQGVQQLDLGNAFMRDPRLDTFYQKLGYKQVNTTHSKRL